MDVAKRWNLWTFWGVDGSVNEELSGTYRDGEKMVGFP
jgi:hypothetical protein